MVPAEDLLLAYPDIETAMEVGSQSRLDGGMHFEESVPAAQELCSTIGGSTVDYALSLLAE